MWLWRARFSRFGKGSCVDEFSEALDEFGGLSEGDEALLAIFWGFQKKFAAGNDVGEAVEEGFGVSEPASGFRSERVDLFPGLPVVFLGDLRTGSYREEAGPKPEEGARGNDAARERRVGQAVGDDVFDEDLLVSNLGVDLLPPVRVGGHKSFGGGQRVGKPEVGRLLVFFKLPHVQGEEEHRGVLQAPFQVCIVLVHFWRRA